MLSKLMRFLVQDDAVVISPRIDELDCNDLGPYLTHALGTVNAIMLGASVSSLKKMIARPTSNLILQSPL